MALLSPYLIPYFTSAKMDAEAENLWETYIPGSLADPELRKAQDLARAMSLSIVHLPLHRHKGVSSILFLIDDCALVPENGALNYVDRYKIQPYSFDEESLRQSEHTFNIDRLTAGDLYEKNAGFREVLDSGKFIYADGHIVRNEPRFVEQAPWGHMLTPWAIRHVDQCCLRFTRIYEQENVGRYVFGRMNYDPAYVEQTMFYLEDLINEKEMDEIEAELQYKATSRAPSWKPLIC